MYGIKSRHIRERLDRALKMLDDECVSHNSKMTELWAIMSDIQLWMEDIEHGRLKGQTITTEDDH